MLFRSDADSKLEVKDLIGHTLQGVEYNCVGYEPLPWDGERMG